MAQVLVLHSSSLSDRVDGDAQGEDQNIRNTKSQLESVQRSILFQKLWSNVTYFKIFCNIVSILCVGENRAMRGPETAKEKRAWHEIRNLQPDKGP